MEIPAPEVLLCDTSYVAHSQLARRNRDRYAHWPQATLERLASGILAITPFTVAEIRFGYISAGWGVTRIEESERQLASFVLIPMDDETLTAYAHLAASCRAVGRMLQHNDLWIAATAISRGLPLVSCDDDQRGLPQLETVYLKADP
jgi:predicted nucleic acid-binding protein